MVNSAEIRDDRQVGDVVRTQVTDAGDLNFELSYAQYDDFLQYALLSAGWSSGGTLAMGTDVSFTTGTNEYNVAAQTGTPFVNMLGQWIEISAANTAANNGLVKIIAVNNAGADVDVVGNGAGATDATDASAVIKDTDQIVNGVSLNSISIEREYTDVADAADQFVLFTGMSIETFALNIAADALITGSFGFIGQDAASQGATSGGTPTGPPTNEVMAAVDDVLSILEGSGASAQYVKLDATNLTLALANNLRGRFNIGDRGPSSVGSGVVAATGTFQAYYVTKALADKHLLFTESALAVIVQDGSKNTYIFDWPRIHYISGQRVAGGQSQDVIADLTWSAFRHVNENVTMRISRIIAA